MHQIHVLIETEGWLMSAKGCGNGTLSFHPTLSLRANSWPSYHFGSLPGTALSKGSCFCNGTNDVSYSSPSLHTTSGSSLGCVWNWPCGLGHVTHTLPYPCPPLLLQLQELHLGVGKTTPDLKMGLDKLSCRDLRLGEAALWLL